MFFLSDFYREVQAYCCIFQEDMAGLVNDYFTVPRLALGRIHITVNN